MWTKSKRTVIAGTRDGVANGLRQLTIERVYRAEYDSWARACFPWAPKGNSPS